MMIVHHHPGNEEDLFASSSSGKSKGVEINKSIYHEIPEDVPARVWKGFVFESEVMSLLDNCDVNYNLKQSVESYEEYVKRQGKGSDVLVQELDLEIECKCNFAKVYPSWILRDFISRFSDSKHKVVVTNDLTKYSSKCRELLSKAGIKLVNPIYLLQRIYRLKYKRMKKSNKYNLNRYSKCYLNNWCYLDCCLNCEEFRFSLNSWSDLREILPVKITISCMNRLEYPGDMLYENVKSDT